MVREEILWVHEGINSGFRLLFKKIYGFSEKVKEAKFQLVK